MAGLLVPPILGWFQQRRHRAGGLTARCERLEADLPQLRSRRAKLFETVSGAKLLMIDGAGHSRMVEKPAETVAEIEGFIDQPGRSQSE